MIRHLKANLLLLGLTLLICCVAYPVALLAIGWTFFPEKVEGSLIRDRDGNGKERIRGSRLIAQPFTGNEYFWPRPSQASYNAAAAGGSNWGASQPKLRDRAAQQMGGLIRYAKDSLSAGTPDQPRTPQQDIAAWYAAKPDRVADWAAEYSVAAANWAKTDLVKDKFGAIASNFFDMWLQDPANAAKVADLVPVPADMVTASGGGLDPHITLRNAQSVYQIDRVVDERIKNTRRDRATVRASVAAILQKHSFTPLSGLIGEPLVNVLEVNIELDREYPLLPEPAKAP